MAYGGNTNMLAGLGEDGDGVFQTSFGKASSGAAASGAAGGVGPMAAMAALSAYQKAKQRKDQEHANKVAGVMRGTSMASDALRAMPAFNPISASRF